MGFSTLCMQRHAVSFSRRGSDNLPEYSPAPSTGQTKLATSWGQESDIFYCKLTKSELTGE